MSSGPSLQDIKASLRTPGARFSLEIALSREHWTYDEFVDLIERCVDHISSELSRNAQLHHQMSEDQLSIQFVHMFRSMGFPAEHDVQIGGHTDISIKDDPDFLWIAEAKRDGANNKLYDGYLQLTTRYTTGLKNENRGAVLVYAQKGVATDVLDSWKQYLDNKKDGSTITIDAAQPLMFRSTNKHPRSGLDFRVRHSVVSLKFAPQK